MKKIGNTFKKKFDKTFSLDKSFLKTLIENKYASVELVKSIHHMSLHPFHLGELGNSIKDILYEGMAKYNHKLGGILLGYQNIKICAPDAAINDDSCFIHMDLNVEFYIFKPEVGKIINGIVNKKSNDHVGCLVHQLFNVSIPKPVGEENWLGDIVEIGEEIQFCITYTQLDARLPYIKAEFISILSEDSGISTSEESSKTKREKSKLLESEEEMSTPKVSKKARKRKLSDSLNEPDVEQKKHKSSIESEEEVVKRKKHKKHKKDHSHDKEMLNELNQKYKDTLSKLAKKINNEEITTLVNELDACDKKSKKHKSKDKEKKCKKSKKEKRDKKDEHDSDISLPELKLDELFKEDVNISSPKSRKYRNSTSHDISWKEKLIPLSPDTDLENLLNSQTEKKTSRKRKTSHSETLESSKCHKLELSTEEVSISSKKEKKNRRKSTM